MKKKKKKKNKRKKKKKKKKKINCIVNREINKNVKNKKK